MISKRKGSEILEFISKCKYYEGRTNELEVRGTTDGAIAVT